MGKDTRITIDLKDDELYRAVRVAAIDRGTSMTDMVCDVLKDWLRKEDAREDLEAYREARGDSARPIDKFLAEIGESRSELAAQG